MAGQSARQRQSGRANAERVRKPWHRSLAQTPVAIVAVHQRDRDQAAIKDFGKADFEVWVRKLDTIDRGWRE